MIARLKAGVSSAQAQADMAAITGRLAREYPKDNRNETALVASLRDRYARTLRPALLVLLVAVALVLLTACMNIAGVLLARGAARHKEMAIRRALGAGKARIARQALTESMLLALIGGALGFLLAYWGVPLLYAAIPARMHPLEPVGVDAFVLSMTLLVSVATGMLFGMAPAWSAATADINTRLKECSSAGAPRIGRSRLRSAFVVSEVALAVMLLTGAGLLLKSFVRLLHVDTGFRAENVLTMRVDRDRSTSTFYPEVSSASPLCRASVRLAPPISSRSMNRAGARMSTSRAARLARQGTSSGRRIAPSAWTISVRWASACFKAVVSSSRISGRERRSSMNRWRGATGQTRIPLASDSKLAPTRRSGFLSLAWLAMSSTTVSILNRRRRCTSWNQCRE